MKGKLPPYKHSFFTSHLRKDGLQLDMLYEDDIVYMDFFVDNRFEGYIDVVHGGMTFGVLDTMLWAAILMETRKIAMTRKVEMEFFKPVLCNTHYRAVAKCDGIEGKDIIISAWLEDGDGELYAKITGIFREARGNWDLPALINRFEFDGVPPEIKDFYLSLLDENQKKDGP